MESNEEDMLGLLIASERVAQWLDTIRAGRAAGRAPPPPRMRQALRDLAEAVQGSEAYAEEARRAGAVPLLTSLLKRTDDEDLLDAASDALAACSGLMATAGGKPRTLCFGGTSITLKEGSLGDGTGAKVWSCAHILCRELASRPELVAGRRMLEIGAGCGACGILAAKLGAASVVLTDYIGPILRLLRECVHLNAPEGCAGQEAAAAATAVAGSTAANGTGTAAVTAAAAEAAAEEDLAAWDPEDASECGSDDFDALLSEAAGGGGANGQQQQQQQQQQREQGGQSGLAWDAPPMHIRFHDWQRDVDALPPAERAALAAAPGVPATTAVPPGASIESPAASEAGAPELGAEEAFDVVLGTDILYEWPMVLMVAAVVKRRVRPGGRAMLCCAVREQSMFDALCCGLRALGLRVGATQVQPRPEERLDLRTDQYEGGFVLLEVEHEL